MSKRPAVFRSRSEVFQADTCEPLKEAVARGELYQKSLCRAPYPGRALLRHELPGVCTVGFWDATADQRWGLGWHRNEGIELTLLATGSLGFAVDGKECQLQPNDLTVTRPWQRHRVGDPDVTAGRLYFLILDVGVRQPHQRWRWPDWIVLTRNDRKELTDILRHNEQPVWPANDDLRHCFERIGQAVETDQEGNNISKLAAYLNELLVLLLDLFRQGQVVLNRSLSSADHTVKLFFDQLRRDDQRLAMSWTVAAMARQCGLGVTHFIHHCKRTTNMTPIQFLNHHRVDAAARILVEHPERSITKVAFALGFSSSQYFAAVFRRQLGSSPRAYRADRCRGVEQSLD